MLAAKPKISIVTPSFNQVAYLETTIKSVLGQGYSDLEYIVLDGGSTDGSDEILKLYGPRLTFWTCEADDGQADAINRGFAMATGDILGWLNSDDFYLPHTLSLIASQIDTDIPEIIFGNCVHIDESSGKAWGSSVPSEAESSSLELRDFIIQPSTFWTRRAWEAVGPLDTKLRFAFDWDWFVRAKRAHVQFTPVGEYLSTYRIHSAHKSGTGGSARLDELISILNRYAGSKYGRALMKLDRARSRVESMRRWIHRFRLQPYEGEILKVLAPGLFGKLAPAEIKEIIRI